MEASKSTLKDYRLRRPGGSRAGIQTYHFRVEHEYNVADNEF